MNHSYQKFRELVREEIEIALDYTAGELADDERQKKRFQDVRGEPDKVVFSRDQNKKPLGLVPMQVSNKRNRVLSKMAIDQFLDLASKGGKYNDYIAQKISEGHLLAPPFLQLTYIKSLNGWHVYAHEGRSRSKTIDELSEKFNTVIPVDLFLYQRRDVDSKMKKLTSDELDQEMIKSLYKRVVPQDYDLKEKKDLERFGETPEFEFLNV